MPKKSLGQHFLRDKDTIDWIISRSHPDQYQVIEIGPGKGALTEHFQPNEVILFEMDDDLVNEWIIKGYRVIRGDAVQTLSKKIPSFKTTKEFQVVSNLPYNASTQIYVELMKLQIPYLVLMFQKEVGEKIRADYGDRNFGRLSLLTKIFYEFIDSKLVPPNAFYPPPKIFSEVLVLQKRKVPLLEVADFSKLESVIKSLFQFPRKKIKAAGVLSEPICNKRPHEITENEWLEILRSKL